jgi:hypothetical protein
MRVILFSDDCFGCGATYKEAFAKLEEAQNGPPDCRNDEEEFLHPPVPIGIVVTDDDGATVDGYGRVCSKGGAWTLSIPLQVDRGPSGNYRFSEMQKWKDEEVERETWQFRRKKFSEEWEAHVRDSAMCAKCPEGKSKCFSDMDCFKKWWNENKKGKEDDGEDR